MLTGRFRPFIVCVVIRTRMSKPRDSLLFRRDQIKRQIAQLLDALLQGSLHKTPSQRGFHLTTKLDQTTRTKYVRKDLVPQVRAMARNHLKVRSLLARLSDANWRLLQLPPEN